MNLDYQMYSSFILFFIGLLGMILRRSWMHILLFSLLSLSGVLLLFNTAEQFHLQYSLAEANNNALYFLLFFSLLFLLSLAVSIMIYRRRGSLRIDELHELEG